MRSELGLVAGLALIAVIGARFVGSDAIWLTAALAVYAAWHAANLSRLLYWLNRPRFRTPVSFGVWEGIFDRLQEINLRNRKRKRDLFGIVRQFRLVLGGLADAVVLLDDRGHVRWFNPAAERLLGLRKPEAIRRPLIELLGHSPLVDQLSTLHDLQATEMTSPVNGAVILRVEVSELPQTGHQLLIARDVTKIHNLEHSRRDFVANVSHELRTPLTVFRGYLETLADEIREQPELAGPVTHLDQQASRMQCLIDDLLDLSRIEFTARSSRGKPVAVPEILESIIREAQYLENFNDHEFIVNIEPKLWLLGDETILQMAFANIIVNAVKPTGPGTRVAIDWHKDEDEAIFQVDDNGPGIAAEHLSRLTERFYRIDAGRSSESGGTGLGLAIAKHGLERHGADLRIESTFGKGSTFSVSFPKARLISAPGTRYQVRPRAAQSDMAAQ